MANKTVIEGSNKVKASHLKELFTQIDSGAITGNHLKALLEHRNPFPWFEHLGDYKFGDYQTVKEFLNSTNRRFSTSLYSQQVFENSTNFELTKEKVTLPLIRTTLSHFGFTTIGSSCGKVTEIVGSVVKLNGKLFTVELCPDEAFIALSNQNTRYKEPLENFTQDKLLILSKILEYSYYGDKKTGIFKLGKSEDGNPALSLDIQSEILTDKEWLVFALHEMK